MSDAIASSAPASARIVKSRLESVASATLPRLGLGLGPFTSEPVGTSPAVQLRDANGAACGLFVNERLAAATAAHLAS